MASNKIFRAGPVALTTTLTTNVLNPPTATGGVNAGSSPQYIVLKHIRISNKTTTAASYSFWVGATGANAAGTEVLNTGKSVPPNDSIDIFTNLRLDAADFLVGGSGTATALTVVFVGEIGVAG